MSYAVSVRSTPCPKLISYITTGDMDKAQSWSLLTILSADYHSLSCLNPHRDLNSRIILGHRYAVRPVGYSIARPFVPAKLNRLNNPQAIQPKFHDYSVRCRKGWLTSASSCRQCAHRSRRIRTCSYPRRYRVRQHQTQGRSQKKI